MYFYISTSSNAYYMDTEYDWRTEDLYTLTSKLNLINLFWYDGCLFDFGETIQQFPQLNCLFLFMSLCQSTWASRLSQQQVIFIDQWYLQTVIWLFILILLQHFGWFFQVDTDAFQKFFLIPTYFFVTQVGISWVRPAYGECSFIWATRLWPTHQVLWYNLMVLVIHFWSNKQMIHASRQKHRSSIWYWSPGMGTGPA